ncbi:MAG: FecR domain-containing protein [Candidatus Thiodiazotropha sp.]|nr:FecR domain-containing protein [Candidatus Thiodiazotropha sp. (ex Codakia orbicularis)]
MEANRAVTQIDQTMPRLGAERYPASTPMSRLRALLMTALLLLPFTPLSATEWIYTVVDGDNLWNFSEKYLDSVMRFEKLRQLNNIKNPKRLQPGTWLRVPMKWIRSNAVPARIAGTEGQVQLTRADGTQPVLKSGTLIRLGDILKTGPKSSVAVLFADDSALTLHSHGEMRFDHLSAHGETGMVDSRLRLIKGRLQTRVRPSAGPGSRFEIYTPSAISAVRGTEYRAAVVKEGNASNIEVLEGKVAVSAAQRQRLVEAGFGTQIVKGEAPAPPVKLLPPPQFVPIPEVVRQIDWQMDWEDIEGAVNYRIEISADQAFTVLAWDQITSQSHLTLAELADNRYWIRVRGIDVNGLEGRGRVAGFVLDAQPQPPLSLNPPDGAVRRGGDVELQWTISENAERYLLEIATDEDFQQIVERVADLQTARYQVQQISEPGTYYWRVTSILGNEPGPPGVVRSWQLKPSIGAVDSTIEEIDKEVTASWESGDPDHRYQVQIALDPEFKDVETDRLTEHSEVSFPQLRGQVRYLRVRAIDSDGYQGPWGSVQRIEPPFDRSVWTIPVLFILGLLVI